MRKERSDATVWEDEQRVRSAFSGAECMIDAFRALGLANPSSNTHYRYASRYLEKYGIEKPTMSQSAKARRTQVETRPLEEILVVGSTYTNNSSLKKRLIKSGLLLNECYSCGNNGLWMGKELKMQLEHKNGISNDNRIENLELLCPNCHSQTETYCRRTTIRA